MESWRKISEADRDRLISALKVALDETSERYKGAVERYSSRPAEIAEAMFIYDLSPSVQEVLKTIDGFQKDRMLYIHTDRGSSAFDPDRVSRALISRTRETGDETRAMDWLEKVLSTTRAEGLRVTLLWGIDCEEKVSLTPGVDLIPVSELPQSYVKDLLQESSRLYPSGTELLAGAVGFWHDRPKAALVYRVAIEPCLSRSVEDRADWDEVRAGSELVNDVVCALTAVGPCAPVSAITWFQFEDSDVDRARFGAATGWPRHDTAPLAFREYGSFDPELARRVVKQYLELEGEARGRIGIALERLNQAIRRHKPGDQALELAIALETLLTDGRVEFRFKVGLRSALLLGGDLALRKKNRNIAVATYDLRSALVHDGKDPETVTVTGRGKIKPDELMREAIPLCAAIIRRMLELGEIPDWDTLELVDREAED